MKKILISLSIIGAVAAVVTGVTTAYFSDTETSSGNTLSAGTIDLAVNGENPLQSVVVTIDDLKPSTWQYQTVTLNNVGENDGEKWIRIENIECIGDDHPESEWGEDPNNSINNIDDYTDFDINGYIYGTLGGLEGQAIELGVLPTGEQEVDELSFHLQSNVTNWAQGDTCTFTLVFGLDQIIPE